MLASTRHLGTRFVAELVRCEARPRKTLIRAADLAALVVCALVAALPVLAESVCPDFPRFRTQPRPDESFPSTAVAADFNGDGIDDVAIGFWYEPLEVWIGEPGGSLRGPITSPLTVGTSELLTGDFDGDGRIDLAIEGDDFVFISRGGGDGRFSAPIVVRAGFGARSVAVGDFDADGRSDFAVNNRDSVQILFSDSLGAWTRTASYAMADQPGPIAAADLDNDGDVDLVAARTLNLTTTVSILLGDGSGGFAQGARFESIKFMTIMGLSDFNGDSVIDLVAGSYDHSLDVWVHAGDGAGGFVLTHMLRSGSGVNSFAFADLNGDGRNDLVSANSRSTTISIFLSSGPAGLLPANDYDPPSAGGSALVGDFDGDGRAELMIVTKWAIHSVPFEQDGTIAVGQSLLVGPGATGIAVADFDGDGDLDLIVASQALSDVSLFRGRGDGSFAPSDEHFGAGRRPTDLVTADFNLDGRPDLAVTSDTAVFVFLNTGNGVMALDAGHGPGETLNGLAAGDFNRDGIPDLAYCSSGTNEVGILLGDGTGKFALSQRIPVGTFPGAIVAAELTGDGLLDLAITNYDEASLDVLIGRAGGEFASYGFYSTLSKPFSITAADFDEDGANDLVTAGIGGISLYMNESRGSFRHARDYKLPGVANAPHAADLNGDGQMDFIVTFEGNGIFSFMGRGDGTFAVRESFPASQASLYVTSADLDKNGVADLAFTRYTPGRLVIMLNGERCERPDRYHPVRR